MAGQSTKRTNTDALPAQDERGGVAGSAEPTPPLSVAGREGTSREGTAQAPGSNPAGARWEAQQSPSVSLRRDNQGATVTLDPAQELLKQIGQRFDELRQGGRAEAWRNLQSDIAKNLHVLVPLVIPMKDAFSLMQQIEDFLKGSTGQVGKSPAETLAGFLNSGEVEGRPVVTLDFSQLGVIQRPLGTGVVEPAPTRIEG